MLVEMGSRHQEKGVWLAIWGLSEFAIEFRVMKFDESTSDMPKLTGWGNEEAKPEGKGVSSRSQEREGGISTPNAGLKQDVD